MSNKKVMRIRMVLNLLSPLILPTSCAAGHMFVYGVIMAGIPVLSVEICEKFQALWLRSA